MSDKTDVVDKSLVVEALERAQFNVHDNREQWLAQIDKAIRIAELHERAVKLLQRCISNENDFAILLEDTIEKSEKLLRSIEEAKK